MVTSLLTARVPLIIILQQRGPRLAYDLQILLGRLNPEEHPLPHLIKCLLDSCRRRTSLHRHMPSSRPLRSSGQQWPPPPVSRCMSRSSRGTPTLSGLRLVSHTLVAGLASITVVASNVQLTTPHVTIVRKLPTLQECAEDSHYLISLQIYHRTPHPCYTWSTSCLNETNHGNHQTPPSLSYEPAPTIRVHMSSLNGQAMVQALPDSGADICVAKLQTTIDHKSLRPIGKLPITLFLGS